MLLCVTDEQGLKYGRMDSRTAHENEQGRCTDGREQVQSTAEWIPKQDTKISRVGIQTVKNRVESTAE